MPPFAAGALVFATSAAVLVLEILAGRVLAPYVGVSQETYTGIIGTVLAGLALGSWAGGKLADQVDPRRILGPVLAMGGALTLLVVPIIRWLGPGIGGSGAVSGIIVLTFAAFFAPATVLSAVTPTVVKIQLSDLHHTGEIVGRLSALGTAGALTGTFAAGFLLVRTAPSTAIIVVVGTALVVVGVVMWVRLGSRPRAAAGVVAVALLGGVLTAALPPPCDVESPYACARVEMDPDRESGRILWIDTLRNSYIDLDDPTHLEFQYFQSVGDVITGVAADGQALDSLHIGGGGFALPRYLAATRPGSTSLVLELDPSLVDLARQELDLRTGPDLEIRTGDARLAMADLGDGAYDLVLGDAFSGLAVPWHLTTREFLSQVHRTMRPDALYVANLIDYPPLGFLRAEIATLLEVFERVALIGPPERLAGDEGGNFVVVATDGEIDAASIEGLAAERGDTDEVLMGDDLDDFVGDAMVLTDDFAPVDQLLGTRS